MLWSCILSNEMEYGKGKGIFDFDFRKGCLMIYH